MNTWLGLLAVLTCVTLVLTALRPGLAVSLGLGLRRHQHRESLAKKRLSWSLAPLRLRSGGGLAQLQVSRIASTSFRVIRPVLFEVLKSS